MEVIIEIENIKKIYHIGTHQVNALAGVSLSIAKKEYVAVMGSSGSGKSTLMNILGCLDSPTEGHYYLNGTDVSSLDDDKLSSIRNAAIGFVFQTFNLLPRYNALENVFVPLIYANKTKTEITEMATEALTKVGLQDRMEHKPNELSGGEKQRVAIARALVNYPSIILADEPTGNLDSRTSKEIMQLLDNLHNQGNTIIVVTHENDIARHANRVIRLQDGLIKDDNGAS